MKVAVSKKTFTLLNQISSQSNLKGFSHFNTWPAPNNYSFENIQNVCVENKVSNISSLLAPVNRWYWSSLFLSLRTPCKAMVQFNVPDDPLKDLRGILYVTEVQGKSSRVQSLNWQSLCVDTSRSSCRMIATSAAKIKGFSSCRKLLCAINSSTCIFL